MPLNSVNAPYTTEASYDDHNPFQVIDGDGNIVEYVLNGKQTPLLFLTELDAKSVSDSLNISDATYLSSLMFPNGKDYGLRRILLYISEGLSGTPSQSNLNEYQQLLHEVINSI